MTPSIWSPWQVNLTKLVLAYISNLVDSNKKIQKWIDNIYKILEEKNDAIGLVKSKIQKQVERTRQEESSPKNTTLFFSILLETKDLLKATIELLQEYYEVYDKSVDPATIESEKEIEK